LDAPETLHHVMVRGLERRVLFRDDRDRADLLARLAAVVQRTGVTVLAWAFLPNHFHLLVRSPPARPGPGVPQGLVAAMRALLTGYAGAFNRRHKRVGHLVQNRYKSILVEEDSYLLELVRYIHLNPLRAGLVKDLAGLARYRWSGHSALLGRVPHPWQAVGEVLGHFGSPVRDARRRYSQFVAEGVPQGRRPDLQGGGLRRSAGGWEGLAALRRGRERWAADERILGSGPFVEAMLRHATTPRGPLPWPRAKALAAVPALVAACAAAWDIPSTEVHGGSRRRPAAHARAAASYLAVTHLGLSAAAVARILGVTPAVVLRGIVRGPALLAARQVDSVRLIARVKRQVA
jgi:REP element-mobilizing transposase RayT